MLFYSSDLFLLLVGRVPDLGLCIQAPPEELALLFVRNFTLASLDRPTLLDLPILICS